MRTNVWLTVENNLAISWWQWLQWYTGDRTGPEPSISEWDKKALTRLVDLTWSFQAFQPADALGKTWRMLSVYDVTHGNIQAGFNQHGEASEGGDLGCAGFWSWEPGDPICVLSDVYPWHPQQVSKFIPDQCADLDCSTQEPATEIFQISLLMGQPWRDIPQDGVDAQALADFLAAQSWDTWADGDRLMVRRNGRVYRASGAWLRRCEYDWLPGPMANDLRAGMQAQGFCA